MANFPCMESSTVGQTREDESAGLKLERLRGNLCAITLAAFDCLHLLASRWSVSPSQPPFTW